MTRVTNYRIEVAREKRRKRDEIVERRKIEVIVTRRQKVREEISLFNEKKKNYVSNTRDEIDPDQADNKYLLLLREAMRGKL